MDDPCMKLNFALLADLPEAASLLSSSFPMAESATTQRELDEFRRQWREEVESRKAQLQQKVKSPPVRHDVQEDPALSQQLESLSLQEPDEVVETKTEEGLHSAATAMDHYIAAVDNERQGKLGQALASYRRAFKLDPDIDHAYKRHYQAQLAAGAVLDGSSGGMPLVQKPVQDEDTFQHVVPVGNEYVAPAAIRKDPLEDLIREFSSQHIEYIPAVDYKPVLISKLPSEIIIHILRHLILSSVSSVANFALACKNFFLLTRSPSLWRFACEHAFRQPYMSVAESRLHQSHHVKAYGGHWMRMFIERPRIRYDGIYISTCHYIRPGSSENTWNQPVHLVTYYRYLRFFPDGTILKYLSTDEPAHVVKLLTPEFSRRQVFRGHFEQREGQVYIEMIDRSRPREHFRMTLTIKSTHRGRHNKLTWIEYASATQGLETETLYDLKLMKPYFFSVVRSYKVDTPSPLDHLEDSY